MAWRRILFGAGVAGAVVAPALACDPEEINAQLTRVCEAALAETAPAAEAVLPYATAAERIRLERSLARAREACAIGDPGFGAEEAARLARLVGRIEARAGATPSIWQHEEHAQR
ncbi:hypothetical protein [Elioraea thermophila]|uniref:hypothetical protein n=1 Tax=Elioraea thermophila TaxID=2185104 RepID=UPI000DF26116|nr:hypothetical protein [Elioraea thermophila]